MMFRHGDILIRKVDSIPEDAELVKNNQRILAEGEATGHAHSLEMPVNILQKGNDLFFNLEKPNAVVHQEHNRIALPEGTYQVIRQREYQPEAPRFVAD